MRIGIDCRFWHQTGVGRYTRNLVLNLLQTDKKNHYFLFVQEEELSQIKKQISKLKISNIKLKLIPVVVPWHSFKEQIFFARILNSQNLDLVHFPYFSVPYFYNKPYVVTIHDLTINKFNTGQASRLPWVIYQGKRFGYRIVLAKALRSSLKIIVPSNYVKKELMQMYKIKDSKITVTYEGGMQSNIDFKKQILDLPKKYFLKVGNFYPHKNVGVLLSAFSKLVRDSKFSDVELLLSGKNDAFYKRFKKEIEKLELDKNVELIENTTDSVLASLYKNASATIVPSLAEGFSLTAVEAMSFGSPLIASDIPVHREICSNNAIYFNPKDANDLKNKMQDILTMNKSDLQKLRLSEIRFSKKFSWVKMAGETLKVYNEVR